MTMRLRLVATALAVLACPLGAGAQTLLPSQTEAIIRHSEEISRQAKEMVRLRDQMGEAMRARATLLPPRASLTLGPSPGGPGWDELEAEHREMMKDLHGGRFDARQD
jgi:hypothetical protein